MRTSISGHISSDRLLYFGLWCAQMLLASFFAAAAVMKLVLHFDRVVEIMVWAAHVPPAVVRTLGVVELLAALILAVPAVARPMQRLVGWVALGFAVLASVGLVFHLVRGEPRMLPLTLAVATLAGFVAWGRLRHAPLQVDEPL